ncbi:TonB-dependent receptor [Portibacter lacus]|uniref:Prevent-host-death protein n=1 Tax=Portibacter lacus TaxID=1099794 RepID=A0AA37SR47_9BACT|nr:TonB-dependent receptor [Portibacter lacus]GLR19148.1 prevent-host-death protein [Portibacter lacus]
MKRLKLAFLTLFTSLAIFTNAQITQVVRGTVVDQESQFPLIGVNVAIPTADGSFLGGTSDLDGNFRIEGVPLGRMSITFSYLGYNDAQLTDIIVNSAKEVILNIKMQEKVMELDEVVVYAKRSGEVSNEMATVSAREFSVQETNRYAGSRGEPARMASNFAGVQGADDSRNDIIIRGNSPQGVLWRLDGFNIPNPNHFSIPGTGGGPVTILNNKFLANSDFFTGAFPAEYGNGIAGVFDLKMRNGNNAKHEFSAQLGFLGTELMAEGPLGNSGASYLATYRYSTLQLFQFLNINVGTDAVPAYQDAAFRLNFPMKKGGNFAIFGIGGLSRIDIILSEDIEVDTSTLIFGSNDRDQYFGSRMGIVGATYTQPININTFVKAGVSASHSYVDANHKYFERSIVDNKYRVDTLLDVLDYTFIENKYSAYVYTNWKVNKKLSLKAGVNTDIYQLNYDDQVRLIVPSATGGETTFQNWQTRWDASDINTLIQPYVQIKYRLNEDLTLTSGLTSTYYSINAQSVSPVEPRLGLSYQIDPKQKIGLGLGVHSQIQSNYLYYYGNRVDNSGSPETYNKDIGLTKSNHLVFSYDRNLAKNMRLKFETYYQYLYNIPVEKEKSSFSLINSGSGFSRLFPNELSNVGDGRNYGVELTVEKFFTSGYYFLVTSSVYNSEYRGSKQVWTNTAFNGNYAMNGLFAKEFNISDKSSINIGGKVTLAGGRRYGNVDREESARQLEIIYKDDDEFNELQFKPYFRTDAKVNYRYNTKKVTHELAIDFVNIFNTKNILTLTYAPDNPLGPIREEYQLGFLPLFYYRIDF